MNNPSRLVLSLDSTALNNLIIPPITVLPNFTTLAYNFYYPITPISKKQTNASAQKTKNKCRHIGKLVLKELFLK
jgi:hypothetical protein